MKIFKKPVYIGLGLFLAGILVTGIVTNTVLKNLNVQEKIQPAENSVLYEEKEEKAHKNQFKIEKISSESVEQNETEPIETPFEMQVPVDGEIIVKYSGNDLVFSKTLGDYRKHNGIDIKSGALEKVYAVENGTIKEKKNDYMLGNTIIIDHGNGFQSVYANLSTTKMVETGQEVKKGDVISGVGDTAISETSEEPHLHFELFKDGTPVNPEEYLPF